MTPKTRLPLELSKKRQRINELLGLESLTDEQRAELETNLEHRATTNVDSQVKQTRWLDRLFAIHTVRRAGRS